MFDPNKRPIWVSEKGVRPHEVLSLSKVKNPKVSVIVPIYNMESKGFLRDLLRSLERQTLDDIELILVDDCSTDNSLAILSEFARERENAVLIELESNGRQGAARNVGLEHARGRYIGFVDGDDVVDSQYFSALLGLIEARSADIAVAPFVLVDEQLSPLSGLEQQVSEADSGDITPESRAHLILSPAHVVCSLYRRSLFDSCGLRFPEGVFFEDNPTCFRLLCQAKSIVCLSPKEKCPSYKYRQSSGSTDHRSDIVVQLVHDRMTTSGMLFDDAVNCGFYDEERDAVDVYYLQIGLLNTLRKIADSGEVEDESSLIREVQASVARRVRIRRKNAVWQDLSVGKRIQILFAYYFPAAYVRALRERRKG